MAAHHGHESHYGEAGAKHAAVPLDPEHDIDAKSSTIWVVGGAVVVLISLWVMLPIFVRVQEEENERKIYSIPNEEYDAVVEVQKQFLGGANPTKQTIEQVLQKMAGK